MPTGVAKARCAFSELTPDVHRKLRLRSRSFSKDREGVNTFTKLDLKTCRKTYSDEVNIPMRRMWKIVGDYKDQRREQKRIYDKLYSVTEGRVL